MWKPGQLITIGDSVYRVSRKARNCVGCDAHGVGCDSDCIIYLKNRSVPCWKQLPMGFALKRISVKYVDLGLPSGTLWAGRNVGAKTPYNYGDHLTFKDAQKYSLPTKEQFDELIKECAWRWNGYGYWVTGKNGNSIFLPATGYRLFSYVYYQGSHGLYLSSTLDSDNPNLTYILRFSSDHAGVSDGRCRYASYAVRLVLNKKPNCT